MIRSKSSKAVINLLTWFVIFTQVTSSAAFADINIFSKATLAPRLASDKSDPKTELISLEPAIEIACRFGNECLLGSSDISATVRSLYNYSQYIDRVDTDRDITLDRGLITIPMKGEAIEMRVCLNDNPEAVSRLGGSYFTPGRFAVRIINKANYILDLADASAKDPGKTGGKASSLARLKSIKGIRTKDGFAVTIEALRDHLAKLNIPEISLLESVSRNWVDLEVKKAEKAASGDSVSEIESRQSDIAAEIERLAGLIRSTISGSSIPADMALQIRTAYEARCRRAGQAIKAAVRSSGEAEDKAEEAFAGSYDTYINISGADDILNHVRLCWASIFNIKAVNERNSARAKRAIARIPEDKSLSQDNAGLSVVVQELVIDPPVSFIGFSIDPVTGRPGIRIDATYGYGEGLVSGDGSNDSWFLSPDGRQILERRIGKKLTRKALDGNGLKSVANPPEMVSRPCLEDAEVIRIAGQVLKVKAAYPETNNIDTEGALEVSREPVFLQARPETKYADKAEVVITVIDEEKAPKDRNILYKGGVCASPGVTTGVLQYLPDIEDFSKVRPGTIILTPKTIHTWTPKFNIIKGVITDIGGINGHAGITGRSVNIPVIVDTDNATDILKKYDGQVITLDANTGTIYLGELSSKKITILQNIWAATPSPAMPEKARSVEIEEMWTGATKAGQTFTTLNGKRYIGRPNYPVKKLQLDIYNRAFDMVERDFGIKFDRSMDGGKLALEFGTNCEIDWAMRKLSIEELEAINAKKRKLAEDITRFARNFTPTRANIEKFIELYTLLNYYMDIGFQFNEACNRFMNEQMRYINTEPGIRARFLDLSLPGAITETDKRGLELAAMTIYARENHLAIFMSGGTPAQIAEKLKSKDPEFFERIMRVIEDYKPSLYGIKTSNLTIKRPIEEFIAVFTKYVKGDSGVKEDDKASGVKNDDLSYNINLALEHFPGLRRVLKLSTEAIHLTQDMHDIKSRIQWPISDGLYKLGEVLRDKGKLKDPEDIFDVTTAQLLSFFDTQVLNISQPKDVSIITIRRGPTDNALSETIGISLGEQVRIDASIHVQEFEYLAIQFEDARKAGNRAEMERCLAEGRRLAGSIKAHLWSNISGIWEESAPMEFVGFHSGDFRFSIIVKPGIRGSFLYAVKCKTDYQEEYMPANPQNFGKIQVNRRDEEKISIDLNGIDAVLNDPKNKTKILDTVRKAASRIKGWQDAKRLGFRALPHQSEELIRDVEDHIKGRIASGVRDVVFIGMGGQASPNNTLQKALRSELYNSFPKLRGGFPRVHILDNFDASLLSNYLKNMGLDPATTDICFNSKSGETTETLVNGYYLLEWLKEAIGEEEALKHVLVISNDKPGDSGDLNRFFSGRNVKKFYIPTAGEDVGGRFSTLSPSGLASAAYAGIDMRRMLDGAISMKKALYDFSEGGVTLAAIKKNPALCAALLVHWNEADGRDILPIATLSSKLRAGASFARQLIGESLGKDEKGIFPVIVTGEHSLRDMARSQGDKLFLILNYLNDNMPSVDMKPHPSIKINIPELDEFTLGEFVYLMEEFVIWSGALLDIDPLIQPKVQLAKDITRDSLKQEVVQVLPGESVALSDEDIYSVGRLDADDVNSIVSYLGEESSAVVFADIDGQLDAVIQFAAEQKKKNIKHILVLGNRERILKTRAVYEAFQDKLRAAGLPRVEFMDETRSERLDEFLRCVPAQDMLVQVMVTPGDMDVLAPNLKKVISHMKSASHNMIMTSEVPEEQVPESIKGYIPKAGRFLRSGKNSTGFTRDIGFTINEVMAFALFGMTKADIAELVKGYADYPEDIAKKLGAYSYLLYQRESFSCTTDVIFSYSDKLWYFNSWAKHRFLHKFADVERGPTIDTAIGSSDQHSILEGMLNWKRKIFTVFLTIEDTSTDLPAIAEGKFASALVPALARGKTIPYILKKMREGVSAAFTRNGVPNVTIKLPRLDYRSFGSLLAIFEKASDHEKKLFKRDIEEQVPPQVSPVIVAVKIHAKEAGIVTGEIDREVYYHYSIIRKLCDYDDSKAMAMILGEMKSTGREFRDVVCGIVGIGPRTQTANAKKPLLTDVLYFGGGGFGACSISRGTMKRYMDLPEDVRAKMPPYAVAAATTAYDDWGNSKQIIDMFLKFWRTYVPAVGDSSAIISWLTIPDEAWFDRNFADDFKPEQLNPKMDLVYVDKRRLTLDQEYDTLEKLILHRIEELNRNPKFKKPKDWFFFVANIVDIARLFDREFVSQGRMKFDKISGQNLVTMGGLIESGYLRKTEFSSDPDFARSLEVMGVEHAYVIPVTFAQKTKGAVLVGYRADGSELFGQNVISSMESGTRAGRIDYVTLKGVGRDKYGRTTGVSNLGSEGLPEINSQTRELIRGARSMIITGAGSPFTSTTAVLITKGFAEELSKRKDIPRVFVLPPMDTLETYGHTVESMIVAMEKSMRKTLGDETIKFEDIFDYVVLPQIPDSVLKRYDLAVRQEKSQYLNREGVDKLMAARTIEEMIDIIRDERYQTPETIKGLEDGSPKIEKILPTNPFPITAGDRDFLNSRRLGVVDVSGEESFFIWEGKIAYKPDELLKAANRARVRYMVKRFGFVHGFTDNFDRLTDIFGGEEEAYTEIEKETLLNNMTVPEVVCGNIAQRDAGKQESAEVEIRSVDHLSFGGGGWHNCSMMRAMEELPRMTDAAGEYTAAHLVPTVDGGGHGRIMADEARRNFGLYVPPLGDFAGVLSWLASGWSGENTFADVTRSGAKMAVLYATSKNRFSGDSLIAEATRRLREVEDKIKSGEFERPKDWGVFAANVLNLSRSLDNSALSHGKLGLKQASPQNMISLAALIDSGALKKVDSDAGLIEASLDRDRNFATRLFRALGIKNTAMQFQTYDQACLVAVLEGFTLKIGGDTFVIKDMGSIRELSLGGRKVVFTPGAAKNSLKVSIDGNEFFIEEGREAETIVNINGVKNIALLDASWSDFKVGDVAFSIMSRRIDGQFFVAMEEHPSRIAKVMLKKMRPKRDIADKIIYDKKTGWIAYEVSDENADVAPTKWAVDYIRKAKRTIRFDAGGALTTQTAALMNKGIVEELSRRTDIPRIYVPPLTKDVIVSGLTLTELIAVMELSMREATGNAKIRFEDIFSHITVPEVPQEVVTRYLSDVKKSTATRLNDRGLKLLERAENIEAIRAILYDDRNINEPSLKELYKDPAKVKATRKKWLPAVLLPITQEDIYAIEARGIGVIKVSDAKYFGIWEDKIVYEPRNLRDLVISIGNGIFTVPKVGVSKNGSEAKPEPLIGHGFTTEDLSSIEPVSWTVSEQFRRTVTELEDIIRNRSPSSLRDRLLTGLEEFKNGAGDRKMGIVNSRYDDTQHYYLGYGTRGRIGIGNEFLDPKDPLSAYSKEALLHELYQAVMSSGIPGEDIEGESTIHYTALRLQAMLFWNLNDVEQAAIQWMTPLELENHPKNLMKRAIIEWKARHSPIPEQMWKDDWKVLLGELKDALKHPERSYKKLADFLVTCNDASVAGFRHKYPVESRYPILRAVALLNDKERDLLISVLKANPKIKKLAIADTILLMLGEGDYENWISQQAPELVGRNIYEASSEIWYPGGGLGRVMQYHGEAKHRLLGPYHYQLRQIEPGYHWCRNAAGDRVPMDYRSREFMANPIVTDLEVVERFPVTVGNRTTEAIVKRGKNDLGITIYLISDKDGFFTHSLYNYNDDGTNQQLPTWEQFTEFMCRASLELYRLQEEKELALKGKNWKASIFHGQDAQFSLIWIYAMFATYQENGVTKRYSDNPVIRATIKAFTTHTYFNREARSGKDGQNRLRTLHIPEEYWDEYFKSNRGSNWEEVYDLTSAGIRTADWMGAVARKHMNDVRIYDEWKGLDLIAVTNGDSRARTSSVFRSILSDKSIFPNEKVDLEHPTDTQILKAKREAKRRVTLKPGQFYTSKEEGDGSILNIDQEVIIYTGRLAPEKVGRKRAFCDANIEALVKAGKQVVIYANIQNYKESRDLAKDITGFDENGNKVKEGLIDRLRARNYTGKFVFVPRFNLADQRALFAAANVGVVDSDPHTEAAGFSETDFASCGALVVAPPWPDGEGILVAQGIRLNPDIEGEGNTLIPEVEVTEQDIATGLVNNDTPLCARIREAYLDIIMRALNMPAEKLAKYMETSYRLSRVLEALPTGAEYLRQLSAAVARKDAKKGDAVEGLKTAYENFRYKTFTADEFAAKRLPFSESTARRELLDLEALGLVVPDKETHPVAYQLAENIRNLSPPRLKTISSMHDLYILTGASAKITSDMNRIHELNLRLRPAIEKDKFIYHVIPIEMVPEKIRPDFRKLVNYINANSREKIEIVARRDILATVTRLSKAKGGRNIVDVAVPYRRDLRGLPKGVKALVFRGAVGGAYNVRQLEGIIAALRALQGKDTKALAAIYELMTGLPFTGRDEDILKYADDPVRLAAFIVFNLKPIRVEDYEALRSFNRSLIELIRSA